MRHCMPRVNSSIHWGEGGVLIKKTSTKGLNTGISNLREEGGVFVTDCRVTCLSHQIPSSRRRSAGLVIETRGDSGTSLLTPTKSGSPYQNQYSTDIN